MKARCLRPCFFRCCPLLRVQTYCLWPCSQSALHLASKLRTGTGNEKNGMDVSGAIYRVVFTRMQKKNRDTPVPATCSCPPRTLRLVSIPPYRPRRLPRCPSVAGSGARGESRESDQKSGSERGRDTSTHVGSSPPSTI